MSTIKQGLRTYNADNTIAIDYTTFVPIIIGSGTCTGGTDLLITDAAALKAINSASGSIRPFIYFTNAILTQIQDPSDVSGTFVPGASIVNPLVNFIGTQGSYTGIQIDYSTLLTQRWYSYTICFCWGGDFVYGIF